MADHEHIKQNSPWMVIHPYGLPHRVDVDQVIYEEQDQWMLASTIVFNEEADARAHMNDLAERNGFLKPMYREPAE